MEQNKHDPNHDPDHAALFAEMDTILADAHLMMEMDDVLADAQNREIGSDIDRAEQYSRQSHFLEQIRPVLDKDVASALDVLYVYEDGRTVLAEDVGASLLEEFESLEAEPDKRAGIEYLAILTDLILEVTEGQTVDEEYVPSYVKSDVQLSVLDNDMFTPWQKHQLIAIIDGLMPGESLDTFDADAVKNALVQRHQD